MSMLQTCLTSPKNTSMLSLSLSPEHLNFKFVTLTRAASQPVALLLICFIDISTTINHHYQYQPVLTIINHCQPLSTIINHYQPLSTIINHYQPLSTIIVDISLSTMINPYQ